MDETEFRRLVQETFGKLARAFENVDPDVAECDEALGTLTITLPGGARCILSTQPSVRQVWLAIASKGIAYHFVWEGKWLDDKGRGIELFACLQDYFKEAVRLDLKF